MPEHRSRPWVLTETTWASVNEHTWEVAVLPWGATEPHNRHLPHGTDTVQAEVVASRAAASAWEAGVRVMVLPAVPFGVQTGQLDLPFALNMNPSTQAALLTDLARCLGGQGIRKLVILNGHGGNDFKGIIRELQPVVDVFLCTVDWYRSVDPRGFFDEPGDHAGELETSVMMHLAPRHTRPVGEAGPGRAREWRVQAFREGWAWAPRPWSQVTDDTGVGNPGSATAERGARFLKAVTERIGRFLVELAEADPDDMFQPPAR